MNLRYECAHGANAYVCVCAYMRMRECVLALMHAYLHIHLRCVCLHLCVRSYMCASVCVYVDS